MATPLTVPIHRLTFEDVLAMVEAGILPGTTQIELERGVLVDMVPVGGDHAARVRWLNRHFTRTLPDALAVCVQDTFLTPDGGFYEPDLMVVDEPGKELPRTAHIVIEVAISSCARDKEKARTYAEAGVTEYWIVDPPAGQVLVHTEPRHDGYGLIRIAVPGETLQPGPGGPPLAVAEVLGLD